MKKSRLDMVAGSIDGQRQVVSGRGAKDDLEWEMEIGRAGFDVPSRRMIDETLRSPISFTT